MRRPNRVFLFCAPALATAIVCFGSDALAQGSATVQGKVINAETNQPVPNVVVTATSPALQGEELVVTDKAGNYRIPSLPPGDAYVIRADGGSGFRPFASKPFTLRAGGSALVQIQILPETMETGIVIVVEATPPVIDYTTGVKTSVGPEFTRRVPTNPPTGKGGATRSFEGLATIAPGTFTDTYGVSVNGTTSPENGFVIDGLSANDAAFGILGTPLSSEFVREVNVITAGYLPEYGRSIGGVMDVVTKSGSNAFHGSFFSAMTPGALEGERTRIPRVGSTIQTNPSLATIQDIGFELGGPILQDRLWFFTGMSLAIQKTRLERSLNKLLYVENPDGTPAVDSMGNPIPIRDSETGFQQTSLLPGTKTTQYATSRTYQYIGKLTFKANQDHNISLSVFGVPQTSGGAGDYPFNLQTGGSAPNLQGPYSAFGGINESFSNNVVLKTSSSFKEKKYLLDTTIGWVHGSITQAAADGSGVADIGSPGTMAGIPNVGWRRSSGGRYPITEFENLPAAAREACAPGGSAEIASLYCPVVNYATGGPGLLRQASQNRIQGRAIFTAIGSLLGQHILKAGIDFEALDYTSARGVSGGNAFRETPDGAFFLDARRFGFLEGPDRPVFLNSFSTTSRSYTVGGFVQDSWNILDRVTLNLGVRYDAQVVTGNDGRIGMTLPNQWSPRVGVIWDPTQKGKAKIFGNFARFYQAITLNLVDRSFPGELQIYSLRGSNVCDPRDPAQVRGACDDPQNLTTINGNTDPTRKFGATGSDRVPVDPDIKPQSSDQLVLGGEYELFTGARIGGAYTHQTLNHAVEDMSRDEANTYFIGNPGHGIAKDFPEAVRDYDSFMIFFEKAFANRWLAQASYTAAYLRGNLAGLFRPETQQLDPNINSDFDLISLLPNREGPLPGDRTHSIKVFGAKEFVLPGNVSISVGGSYTARSGTPINVLGAHPQYLTGEVFILPRGEGGRTPWVHSIDTNVTAGFQLGKDKSVTFGVDIFNIFNFQAVTGVDSNYTFADVRPIAGGTMDDLPAAKGKLVYWDGQPFNDVDKNPNFGNPNAFQLPRQVRFNARVTF
ncbi:TonB-dependent receptor [Polyangium fumosum]|uniref:TonB-dependent receptor n=1 Tax=Polyangium fumosum TaxID=889272 RepID=UPI001E45E13D|nr:TonB-dependent receptor [Polyangium fumosum]